MVKIRVIFIKQFAFRRKGRHKQVFFSDQKISWLTYSYEIKWWSLPWNGSWSKIQIKRIHNTHTHTHLWRICDINQSLIKSVWNYTKRHPRPFVLILWTSSFTLQVMKKLIFLANSHRPFIIVKWFLAWQTNTLNDCFRILSTLPASKLSDCYSYDPIVHGAKS